AGGHYNMVPLAWLPLVLLFLERGLRHKSVWSATWAGATFSLFLLGAYPYVTLYSGLFVALWTLGTALEEAGVIGQDFGARDLAGDPKRRRVARALGWWAGLGAWTLLVAVALGAIQLLPGIEAAKLASRSEGVPFSGQLVLDGLRSVVGLVGPALSD